MKKLIVLLFLTGCMVGPNYSPPELTLSEDWNAEPTADREIPPQKWWETLGDDLLNQTIDAALACNYDLQAAEANILKARAMRQVTASKLFPKVSLDPNGTKTYFSKNGPLFAIGPAAGNPTDTSSPTTGLPFAIQIPQIQNLFNALFDASWELDFFGKTRRSVEAAQAEYESAIDHKNGVLISILAEVARNYIDLRSYQKRAQLLEENIRLYEQQTQIIQRNVQYGYSNQVTLEQIEAALADAKAALPEAHSEIYRAIYTLSILTGRPPETLVDELLPERPLPSAPEHIAVGLRSDLLRRRPDIRYAERKLAEATANIGVAVAAFFPTTTLLGDGGFQSLVLPELLEWGSRTFAYGAAFNMPIFQGGRLVGNLRFAQADQAYTAANYQQTVLNALQDAESTLKKYKDQTLVTKNREDHLKHIQFVVTLTRERHLKGLVSLIDLLSSEMQLVASAKLELDSKTAELLSLVALYKSLGGGWECSADSPVCNPDAH